jgi:hypothetical protein
MPVINWTPSDEGGAGAGDGGSGSGDAASGNPGGGSGDGGEGGAGSGGGASGKGGASGAGGDGGAGDGSPWYDSRQWSDPALKDFAIKNGYHKGTADEALEKALKGEMSAASRLGKDPNMIAELPGPDGSAADFLKANASALGVPDSVDDYKLSLPDDLPKDMPIDQPMMDSFAKMAHEAGLPPEIAQMSVSFYAQHMTDWMNEQTGKIENAEKALEAQLKEKWGGNWEANRDQGARAFQALAAQMDLDAEAAANIATKLNEGMGDVHLVQFTHALAGLISEDTLINVPGGGVPSGDLAHAQQRKAQIMGPDGEMAQARGNQAKIKSLQNELAAANRVIVGHRGQK